MTKLKFSMPAACEIKKVTINDELMAIPNEWTSSRISSVCNFRNGFAFNSSNSQQEPTNYKIIKIGHISFSKRYVPFITGQTYAKEPQPNFELANGEIIIGMDDLTPDGAFIGTACIIQDEYQLYQNQRLGTLKDVKINPIFLANQINNNQKTFARQSTGSTVRHLSKPTIENFEFPLPPTTEIESISNILDSQNKTIKDLSTLIKTHQSYICSLQETLLSGRLRVALSEQKKQELVDAKIITLGSTIEISPERFIDFAKSISFESDITFFTNPSEQWIYEECNEIQQVMPFDWEVKKLHTKITFEKGKSVPETQLNYSGNGIKYLKTTEFWLDSASKRDTVHYTGKVDPKHIKHKDEYVFSLDGFNSKIGEGTLGLVSNEDEGIVSTSFYKLVKNDIYHLVVNVLKSNHVQNFIMRLGEGTTVFHAGKYLNNLQGIFPKSTVEQKLLSMIFEKEEKLIDALKEKIKMEEKVFKYLQQELLSGRIRVTTEV